MNAPLLEAVIFDMDGLMLDTERIARAAWTRAFAESGIALNDEIYLQAIGRTTHDTHELFRAAFGLDGELDDIARRKAAYQREMYAEQVPVKPGLSELLDTLDALRAPKAVATSTFRELAMYKLDATNLRRRFDAIVCGDEVPHGKPAPDIFVEAARRLSVEPALCAVLEDSEPGILAAKAAGARAIMVPDQKQPSPEIAALADIVCGSLADARRVVVGWLRTNV